MTQTHNTDEFLCVESILSEDTHVPGEEGSVCTDPVCLTIIFLLPISTQQRRSVFIVCVCVCVHTELKQCYIPFIL